MTPPAAGSAPAPATLEIDDLDVIGQADWVIGGEEAQKGRKQAWYGAYVAFLGALAYGFPVAQAVFRTTDPAWLRQQLSSPVALGGVVLSIAGILWALYSAGSVRGPVVPPLPWIDHVVTTPIDRALAVRRWWQVSLGASIFGGALTGLVLGGGIAFAGIAPWYAVVLATLVGAGLGWLAGSIWLWGQVRSWPGGPRGPRLVLRHADALRGLHIEGLRTHSANTSTIGGSVMAGNLRTARLQLARPVRHARRARLRPAGPFAVLVRRDVLGLRRIPSSFWTGLAFTAMGTAVIVWTLTHPAAPVLAITLGLLPAYLGFGAWAEGLRLQADNAGTPSLLGATERLQAWAHLVVPTLLTVLALAVGLLVSSRSGGDVVAGALMAPVLVGLLAGGHLLAAFRGSPPQAAFASSSGPTTLVFWYVLPGLVVLVLGTFTTWLVRNTTTGLTWALPLAVLVVGWGLLRVDKLALAHRV